MPRLDRLDDLVGEHADDRIATARNSQPDRERRRRSRVDDRGQRRCVASPASRQPVRRVEPDHSAGAEQDEQRECQRQRLSTSTRRIARSPSCATQRRKARIIAAAMRFAASVAASAAWSPRRPRSTFPEHTLTSPTYDVVAIGNAIVDILATADDAFIAETA